MADLFKLSLLSPERKLEEKQEVSEVTLTGSEGQIQIFPGHAPMIGTLEPGIFSYKTPDGADHRGIIMGGFFQVSGDHLSMLAEHVELNGEINVEHAKQMQKEAEDLLKAANLDEHKFKEYQAKLEHAMVRQQSATHGH